MHLLQCVCSYSAHFDSSRLHYAVCVCVVCVLQRARQEGVRQGHEDRVRGLQRELKGDMYKDAEVKHKDMLITLRVSCVCVCVYMYVYVYVCEFQTTEMAAKDLEKYYRVLDRFECLCFE